MHRLNVRNRGVGGQIVIRVLRNFDRSNALEMARHGKGKQSHSGKQVERGASAAIGRHQLNQLRGQKAVGLEKRSCRDPVAVAAHVVDHARRALNIGDSSPAQPARLFDVAVFQIALGGSAGKDRNPGNLRHPLPQELGKVRQQHRGGRVMDEQLHQQLAVIVVGKELNFAQRGIARRLRRKLPQARQWRG